LRPCLTPVSSSARAACRAPHGVLCFLAKIEDLECVRSRMSESKFKHKTNQTTQERASGEYCQEPAANVASRDLGHDKSGVKFGEVDLYCRKHNVPWTERFGS
jgi:hypothetical protein